jgi:L-asparaginase
MPRKRLLFLHTGGTLGMAPLDPGPLAPAHYEEAVLPYVRGLGDVAHIEGRVVCNLDSSDLEPVHWEALGQTIAEHIDDFDGFLVLHGTDTMAFTATALSLMLQGLPKPVVLTGSQRPLMDIRTDARRNLVHSAFAASQAIPEVGLYFGEHLYRGNRATKVSIQAYDAFDSPNHPPLLTMGVDVVVGDTLPPPTAPLHLATGFCTDVAVLSLFPGMSADILRMLVDGGTKGVVLRGFGQGNVPAEHWPAAIEELTRQGIPVIITSQCRQGPVAPGRYVGSQAAFDKGAIFGGDLTGEAATVKTMWLLGQGRTRDQIRHELLVPIAGECRPGSDQLPVGAS